MSLVAVLICLITRCEKRWFLIIAPSSSVATESAIPDESVEFLKERFTPQSNLNDIKDVKYCRIVWIGATIVMIIWSHLPFSSTVFRGLAIKNLQISFGLVIGLWMVWHADVVLESNPYSDDSLIKIDVISSLLINSRFNSATSSVETKWKCFD